MLERKRFVSRPPVRRFLSGCGWGMWCGLLMLGGRLLAAEPAPAAPADLGSLKEQIKREVLAELCQQLGDAAAEVNQAHDRLKQEIKQELLQELRQELLKSAPATPATPPATPPVAPARPGPPAQTAAPPPAPATPAVVPAPAPTPVVEHPQAAPQPPVEFGDAEGRILNHGKPLANCKVRLVRLESSRFLLIRSVKYGVEFETTTDEQGHYRFHHIPAGDYKLKWLPPGADGWVRRLRDKPDVTVVPNKTATLKAVEAGIAPVAVGHGE